LWERTVRAHSKKGVSEASAEAGVGGVAVTAEKKKRKI